MTPKTGQRNDIQGFRALAVLAVIAFHVDRNLLPAGFLGVDIFLVISGYLITDIILRQQQSGTFSLLNFYAARIRRIVPAYVVLLLSTALVMAVLLIPVDFARFKNSLLSALYFNSNHYFSHQGDYFAPETHELPLLHTWSLAVEMQFYLAFPFLLKLTSKRALPSILIVGIIGFWSYSICRSGVGEDWTYYSLSLRIPEFLVGGLIAAHNIGSSWHQRMRNRVALLGVLLVLASGTTISMRPDLTNQLLLPACIGVALIIAARTSVLNDFVSYAPLARIGDLSYSLYLWHWPILAAMRYWYQSYKLPVFAIFTAVLLTAALSYFSYHFIEQPFRRVGPRRTVQLRYGCLFATAVLVVLATPRLNAKLVPPFPDTFTRYAPAAEICHGQVAADCSRGAPAAKARLLLLGDSHAAQLNYFAEIVGKELGIRFDVITASSCVPITHFDVERIKSFARKPCREQIIEANDRLYTHGGVIVAARWRFHTESTAFMVALTEFLEETLKIGKPVLVLSQTPEWKENVQRILRFAALGFPRSAHLQDDWHAANDQVKRLVEGYPHATFLDLSTLPVFNNAPYYDGKPIYFDNNHLNEIGSVKYGEAAIPYIREWIEENL